MNDQLLWDAFTTEVKPRLRQSRQELLACANGLITVTHAKCMREKARLITYYHNLNLRMYRSRLAKLKALSHVLLEEREEAVSSGEQRVRFGIPADGEPPCGPLIEIGVMDEGAYVRDAKALKQDVEMFEEAELAL